MSLLTILLSLFITPAFAAQPTTTLYRGELHITSDNDDATKRDRNCPATFKIARDGQRVVFSLDFQCPGDEISSRVIGDDTYYLSFGRIMDSASRGWCGPAHTQRGIYLFGKIRLVIACDDNSLELDVSNASADQIKFQYVYSGRFYTVYSGTLKRVR